MNKNTYLHSTIEEFIKWSINTAHKHGQDADPNPDLSTLLIQEPLPWSGIHANIGYGSSSSHTAGPMKWALNIRDFIIKQPEIKNIEIELHDSMWETGLTHFTPMAILWGFQTKSNQNLNDTDRTEILQNFMKTKTITIGPHPSIPLSFKQGAPQKKPNGLTAKITIKNQPICTFKSRSIGRGDLLDTHTTTTHSSPIKTNPFEAETYQEMLTKTIETYQKHPHLSQNIHTLLKKINEEPNGDPKHDIHLLHKVWDWCEKTYTDLPPTHKLIGNFQEPIGKKLRDNLSSSSPPIQSAMAYAIQIQEHIANAGITIALPTFGAGGIIPAFIISFHDEYKKNTKTEISSDQKTQYILTLLLAFAHMSTTIRLSGACSGCTGETVAGEAAGIIAALTTFCNLPFKYATLYGTLLLAHKSHLPCEPTNGGMVQMPCIPRNAESVGMIWHLFNLFHHTSNNQNKPSAHQPFLKEFCNNHNQDLNHLTHQNTLSILNTTLSSIANKPILPHSHRETSLGGMGLLICKKRSITHKKTSLSTTPSNKTDTPLQKNKQKNVEPLYLLLEKTNPYFKTPTHPTEKLKKKFTSYLKTLKTELKNPKDLSDFHEYQLQIIAATHTLLHQQNIHPQLIDQRCALLLQSCRITPQKEVPISIQCELFQITAQNHIQLQALYPADIKYTSLGMTDMIKVMNQDGYPFGRFGKQNRIETKLSSESKRTTSAPTSSVMPITRSKRRYLPINRIVS